MRDRHRARELKPNESQGRSSHELRRLASQGVKAARGGPMFPPGSVVSVELRRCSHRARVEVLTNGHVPHRARCPRCLRWSDILAETARPPARPQAVVVAERIEAYDCRPYTVQVLAPARRASRSTT